MPQVNTGQKEKRQTDINPNSATVGASRWVPGGTDLVLCPVVGIYRSAQIQETVYRDDCGAGTSTGVAYTVAEGHVVDSTSLADVNARARAYFEATKQAFANANAICLAGAGPGGGAGGNSDRECQYDSQGCWTGWMVDAVGNVLTPDGAECQACNTYTNPYSPCALVACA